MYKYIYLYCIKSVYINITKVNINLLFFFKKKCRSETNVNIVRNICYISILSLKKIYYSLRNILLRINIFTKYINMADPKYADLPGIVSIYIVKIKIMTNYSF